MIVWGRTCLLCLQCTYFNIILNYRKNRLSFSRQNNIFNLFTVNMASHNNFVMMTPFLLFNRNKANFVILWSLKYTRYELVTENYFNPYSVRHQIGTVPPYITNNIRDINLRRTTSPLVCQAVLGSSPMSMFFSITQCYCILRSLWATFLTIYFFFSEALFQKHQRGPALPVLMKM